MIRRFDQGSVTLSYLQVRRTGKGQTAETRARLESAIPSYLVIPFTHARARTHPRIYTRAHVCICNLGMYRYGGMTDIAAARVSAVIPFTVFNKRYGFQCYRTS